MALKLVKRVSQPPPDANSQKGREEYLLACLRDEYNDPRFSDWEKQFISSVARQVDGGRKLSDKQKAILERIWQK